MNIDLKIQLPSTALGDIAVSTLAALGADIDLPDHAERVTVSCQFVGDDGALVASLQDLPKGRRQVFIVVSPGLVDHGPHDVRASALATRLLKLSWRERIVVGLVGVIPAAAGNVAGLDWVINQPTIDCRALRVAVQKVARTLWFKLPPATRNEQVNSGTDLKLRPIKSRRLFRQSLQLRHEVYSALGYIDTRVADAALGLEFDGYDPAALHYAVTSRNEPGRVAATMRIIVPGRRAVPRMERARETRYSAWCEEFANEEESRVFRDLLHRRCMNSLPLLDSFDYFNSAGEQCLLREMVFPDHSCEVSRIVVHPDFRGCGILTMLMNKAISVAAKMGKRYLLLECAPFHEHMYSKYGFQVVEDERRERYYARAQRLDSWAVAMHRKIVRKDGHADLLRRAHAPRHVENSCVPA